MTEVAHPDRASLLRSKKELQRGIVASRKRKLREFWAVCQSEGPVPSKYEGVDAPPASDDETTFLDACDIMKGRTFDEALLPPRRQLRSEVTKTRDVRNGNDVKAGEPSRKASKAQRDASRTRKSRTTTPSSRSDAGVGKDRDVDGESVQRQRSVSRGSQTELPVDSAIVLDDIVEEILDRASRPKPDAPDQDVPPGELEMERVEELESAPNSPGVDPQATLPNSGEAAAAGLEEMSVEGPGSRNNPHKAAVVHLPPRDVQERRLKAADKTREQKDSPSASVSARDGARPAEPVSSPGSTTGAQSATTPALHEMSTDTSPENDNSRYDPELEKDEDVPTPPELRPTPEEAAEKAEHDRLHQAQLEIAVEKILRSSPTVEAESAVDEPGPSAYGAQMDEEPASLTNEAGKVVEDVVNDAAEVRAAASGEGSAMEGVETSIGKEPEIADSEAEDNSEAMDVDRTTVQDSFETRGGSSPARPRAAAISVDSEKVSATPTASTPRRSPTTPGGSGTFERMATRESTGALRHKSVSEILTGRILGEVPTPNTSSRPDSRGPKLATDSDSGASGSPSRSATPQSPGSRMKSLVEKAKEKERSKLSTVVFAKQPSKPANDTALVAANKRKFMDPKDDYFTPLFIATVSPDKRGPHSLDQLLQSAHKTITTANAYVPINENRATKVLKRVYALQNAGKWTLRQPKRAEEPKRPSSHWDVLLQEAKWMRTDFREERKWKMAVARNLAFACAEWFEASPEDRKLLQVNAQIPPRGDTEMADVSSQAQPTPDLVASGDLDSPVDDFDDELNLSLLETVAPTAIFGLQDDDVVFGLRKSPTTDKLLAELPMYGAPLCVPSMEPSLTELDADRFWRREALPLNKYVEGRMELKVEGPPRKRSRFEYDEDDDDEDQVVFGDQSGKRPILPPETVDVALFNPDFKHIRDRIHTGHQFRPPTEYKMPEQNFFEYRQASQWTWAEDDELKNFVREYQYNWSLISNLLTKPSLYISGPERRTPWECFERWISLEGMPTEMGKTTYFRMYNARMETAARNVAAMAAAEANRAPAGQVVPQRRKSTQSVRVERRRNQKHMAMVDAMKKLAKKRETALQKQQHAAGMAAMRKNNEAPQSKPPLKTPQEFSKAKHDQQERLKEQMMLFQQRAEAQRKLAIQQRIQQAQNGQQPASNANPQQRHPNAPTNAPTGQNLTVPGQNRARGPVPPQVANQMQMQNNLRPPQAMVNGVPQAPMQTMPGQLPLPNPALDVGLVNQAQRITDQQRQAIHMRQQSQGSGVHNSPPRNMLAMSPPGFPQMSTANMMAFSSNTNGVSSPGSGPSPPQGQAGSPRMGQHNQQVASNMVPLPVRLEEQIRAKYPGATQEQVVRMVTESMTKSAQRQGMAQNAMNAAAGGMGMGGPMQGRMPVGVENSPQLYAQMLRQQQENQQKAAAAAAAAAAGNQQQQGPSQGPSQGQGHSRSASATSEKKAQMI